MFPSSDQFFLRAHCQFLFFFQMVLDLVINTQERVVFSNFILLQNVAQKTLDHGTFQFTSNHLRIRLG